MTLQISQATDKRTNASTDKHRERERERDELTNRSMSPLRKATTFASGA